MLEVWSFQPTNLRPAPLPALRDCRPNEHASSPATDNTYTPTLRRAVASSLQLHVPSSP